jgi:hypothetical protein
MRDDNLCSRCKGVVIGILLSTLLAFIFIEEIVPFSSDTEISWQLHSPADGAATQGMDAFEMDETQIVGLSTVF